MWRFFILGILLLLTAVSELKAVESIGFYYNKIDSVRELINYDRVVVNPDFLSDRQLAVLHKAESKVYAYLSVGELDLAYVVASAKKPLADLSSIPHDINPIWQTRVIDQTSLIWQNYLVSQTKHFAKRGFDGVFLDTVDSYQLLDKEQFNPALQKQALINTIKQISKTQNKDKKLKLIINRGFELLEKITEETINLEAVVAESLFQKFNLQKQHYYPVKKEDTLWLTIQLQNIVKRNIEVIVIDYASPWNKSKQRQLAKNILQSGYTPYVADGLLHTLGISTIEPIGKRVLGFYDGHMVNDMTYSKCHRLISMPLEYLGYVPECIDINNFVPANIDLTRYAGVIFWLGAEAFDKNELINDWIFNLIGKKRILFLGALPTNRKLLNKLGLTRKRDLSGKITLSKGNAIFNKTKQSGLSNKNTNPQFSPFEVYADWKLTDKENEVFIEIKDENSNTSALVFNSYWGGAALTPMPVATLANNQSKWMLDPFWLLDKTLKLAIIPSADITRESGRRIVTTHIDGDGFPSRSGFTKQPFVSQIILDEILSKRKTPHTVSVIEAEVSKNGLYPQLSEELETIAKKMFKLTHVEAASHTFSHPFYWNEQTARKVKAYGAHLPVKGYELDYFKEIVGSANYIKSLLPANKEVKLILWSGAADPTEEQIMIAENSGLLNVNGGNTYSVIGNDDFSEVSPNIVWHQNAVQVYAPIQNENLHTNLWSENFDGFSRVIETFKNLNQPRALKPISLYYHMYSGTYPASLQSLNNVYDWIEKQKTTPLYLSEYALRAKSLYETGLAKDLFGGWQIVSTGIKSVRIPLSLGIPEIKNSNVIGWNKEFDGNYLILNKVRTFLSLKTRIKKKSIEKRLVNANAQILKWQNLKGNIYWKVLSHTPLKMTLRNFHHCKIESNVQIDVKHYGRLTQISSETSGEIGGVINCN
ncbi:MAG: RNA-binding protein [Kangiella sp.]|nr:MAG: RNA-binding protein [Kangiella sp.]